MHTSGNSSTDTSLIRDIYCGPEVLFETCVAMKFVDNDDDDDDADVDAIESSGGGVDIHHRLLTELLMLKDSVMTDDGLCANISIPIMEDLHLRKFPPVDAAHSHLDFTCLRNSANLSAEQQVLMQHRS